MDIYASGTSESVNIFLYVYLSILKNIKKNINDISPWYFRKFITAITSEK